MADEEKLRREVAKAVIDCYHTTRPMGVPAEDHVLSKSYAVEKFDALRDHYQARTFEGDEAEVRDNLCRIAEKAEGYGMSFHDPAGSSRSASLNLYGPQAKAAIWLLKNAACIVALLDAKDAEIREKEERRQEYQDACGRHREAAQLANEARDEALAAKERAEQALVTANDYIDNLEAEGEELTERCEHAERALAERDAAIVEAVRRHDAKEGWAVEPLRPFIPAPEPDPLVEAMRDACAKQGLPTTHTPGELAVHLYAAIEARGGKVVFD